MKTLYLAAVLALVPACLQCAPIRYTASFTASGTFTDTAGVAHPFTGPVVFSMANDTTNVKVIFQDGSPVGYQTNASPVLILIKGLGTFVATLPMHLLSEGYLELFADTDNYLVTSFVFNNNKTYNLQSNYSQSASWNINYFNMGILNTTKGQLTFTDATTNGTFTATLQ